MSSPQSGVGTVHKPGAIGAVPAKPTQQQLKAQVTRRPAQKAAAKPAARPAARKSGNGRKR